MKIGDVGMAKHFYKKYGMKGWAFDYPVSAIWKKFLFCQDACQCLMLHPYITASSTIFVLSWVEFRHWTLQVCRQLCFVLVIKKIIYYKWKSKDLELLKKVRIVRKQKRLSLEIRHEHSISVPDSTSRSWEDAIFSIFFLLQAILKHFVRTRRSVHFVSFKKFD